MNFFERSVLIVELGGLEYGLPWWASWLVIAALAIYVAGAIRMAVECYRDEVDPPAAAVVVALWPLIWLVALYSERKK